LIKGVIAPNLTFFNKDGSIDLEKCRWHMDWMLDKGVDGLFVTGTYGSGYLMSAEERIKVYSLAKEVSDSHAGAFAIAHVGCPDTATSIALTKAADQIGLRAVSAIVPYQYKYTADEILGFYESLVNSANIPVYAYNNPEITGLPITCGMAERLAKLGVSGLKDSAIDIQLASGIYSSNALNTKNFQYIAGTTTGWIAFRKLGVDAMIAGMCNYVPELVVDLYRYSFTDERKALSVYQIMNDLAAEIKSGNSLVSSHLALHARGFDAGFMRPPLKVSYDVPDKIQRTGRLIDQALHEAFMVKSGTVEKVD